MYAALIQLWTPTSTTKTKYVLCPSLHILLVTLLIPGYRSYYQPSHLYINCISESLTLACYHLRKLVQAKRKMKLYWPPAFPVISFQSPCRIAALIVALKGRSDSLPHSRSSDSDHIVAGWMGSMLWRSSLRGDGLPRLQQGENLNWICNKPDQNCGLCKKK